MDHHVKGTQSIPENPKLRLKILTIYPKNPIKKAHQQWLVSPTMSLT